MEFSSFVSKDKIKNLIRFKKKPIKTSRDSYVFWIPKQYVSNGLIDPEKEYWVYIEETNDNDEEEDETTH